ncbi:murein hydrolase activator EnvC family protein [Metabacillus litoralis]|uniref:murein hydrolase activator EnvC family protein n=1 Tax=Metabacillus litoralis TaxID=152268 RepID=UPI00203DA801|nr:peptidoglycan DD-metalloendopeptidase family protein [Metabacillus litoralis]MCM3654165.1 peptidoglycan DD-metalloendopeptidase family protein [Metabacillus litoralis]
MSIRNVFTFTIGVTAVICASSLLPTSAFANTSSELENKKETIKEQRSSIQSEINGAKGEINSLDSEQKKVVQEIERLDSAVAVTSEKIRGKEAEITKTKEDIEALKKEIEVVTERIEKRNEILKDRVRSIQQNGGTISYLDVLLGVQSFSDLISRINAVTTIVEADKDLLKAHQEDKFLKEEKEKEFNNQLSSLENDLTDLEQLKKQLNSQIDEKTNLMKRIEEEHEQLSRELDKLQDEEAALTALEGQVQSEMKRLEQERQKSVQNGEKVITGSGRLSSPMAPGSFRISSPYGWRVHPVHGTRKHHNGVDFAAPVGTPIYASDSGYVLYAGAANGYGNWIVIDHGDLITIYGHMYSNQVYVSPGERVEKGQQIAAVGSDGYSTGPHLHFSVSRGGSLTNYVDPMTLLR